MSEAKWYVVHTYSGYENKVKANIEKTIENRHLEDQILEVRVPLEDVVEMRNGVSKQVQRKMFPSYVLINMVMNDDTWYVVRNTRGVTGFVGPGSKPVPLTEEEMKRRVIARTGYADEKGLNFMVSAVQKIHAYLKEEDIQDGVCGYRELENWVRTFQAIKDVRRAAQVAVISKATMDPEEQEHLMKTYVEPYC